MTDTIYDIHTETKTALGTEDTTRRLIGPKRNIERIKIWELPVRIKTQNYGHAYVVGHAINGKVGANNGIDGQQITVGINGLGALGTSYVICPNNTFVETLRTTRFVDTSNTTASVDTTNHTIDFSTGFGIKVFQTECIFNNGNTITQVTLKIDDGNISGVGGGGTYQFQFRTSSSNVWENISNNTPYDFINSGTSLYMRILGSGVIFNIEDDYGVSIPITVEVS